MILTVNSSQKDGAKKKKLTIEKNSETMWKFSGCLTFDKEKQLWKNIDERKGFICGRLRSNFEKVNKIFAKTCNVKYNQYKVQN